MEDKAKKSFWDAMKSKTPEGNKKADAYLKKLEARLEKKRKKYKMKDK